MITQDVCAFYNDHSVYADFGGVVLDLEEGDRIAAALGHRKAVILQNHGLLTVGQTVDEAAWWYITMERSCQVQLMAEAAAAGTREPIKQIRKEVGPNRLIKLSVRRSPAGSSSSRCTPESSKSNLTCLTEATRPSSLASCILQFAFRVLQP